MSVALRHQPLAEALSRDRTLWMSRLDPESLMPVLPTRAADKPPEPAR